MFIATLCRAVSFVLGVVPFDLYQQLLNLRYLRRQSNCRRLELRKSCKRFDYCAFDGYLDFLDNPIQSPYKQNSMDGYAHFLR